MSLSKAIYAILKFGSHIYQITYLPQSGPVKQFAEPFRSVSLDDSLAAGHPTKMVKKLKMHIDIEVTTQARVELAA